MFLLNIILIYDDPLLRSQPPLSGNSPYPEGGFLMAVQLYLSIEKQYSFHTNPQVAMLSKNGFYRLLHLRSLLCTPSSKRL